MALNTKRILPYNACSVLFPSEFFFWGGGETEKQAGQELIWMGLGSK